MGLRLVCIEHNVVGHRSLGQRLFSCGGVVMGGVVLVHVMVWVVLGRVVMIIVHRRSKQQQPYRLKQ